MTKLDTPRERVHFSGNKNRLKMLEELLTFAIKSTPQETVSSELFLNTTALFLNSIILLKVGVQILKKKKGRKNTKNKIAHYPHPYEHKMFN